MKKLQNNSYLKRKTLSGTINSAQKLLILFAKKNGIYENFGVEQVNKISEKFINISEYSQQMNINRNQISQFSNWCSNYSI